MTYRFVLRPFLFAGALLFLAMAPSSATAQSTSETALGPPPSQPRIEIIGHASGIDLADLGPDFAHPWLAELRSFLGQSDEAPTRIERHDPDTKRRTRTTFRYDDAGRRLEARTATRRDTGWVPQRRTTYTYRNAHLANQREAAWTGDGWHPERRWTFHHDDQGHLARAVQHTRTDASATWTPATRLLFTAGTDAYQIEQHVREDGGWTPVARATFAAPEAGRRIIQKVALWEPSGWTPSSRTAFTYDFTGRPIEAHMTIWTGTRWTDGPQHLYTHAIRGERVVQTTETWMGTLQLNTRTATFTYATAPAEPLILGDGGLK